MHVALADRAAHIHMRVEMFRAEPAAGQVDDDRLDLDLGHALGRVDGEPDRVLGGFEIDDRRRPSGRAER